MLCQFRFLSKLISVFALVLTIFFISASAFAQSESSRPKVPKKQTLSFEDELVEGSAQKPELFYLFQKKNFNYNRLIRLRENFLPEMRKTSEDIQRIRGGH